MPIAVSPFQILCVDDETLFLELCTLYLEKEGDYNVDTVTSGMQALTKLAEKEYDAIISDYKMPGMNGVELLNKIRSSGNNIPFIIFTGRGREEVVIESLNSGADFYLQKGGDPIAQFTELKSKVGHAIRQKQADSALVQEREQLLSIFDSLEQNVYVADPDTYEILYVNRYLQNLLNKEVIGKICYEEFQNKSSPCEFCTNDIIISQKPLPHTWEFYNPVLERYFSIVDRIIRWPDGRDVRLEVTLDITETKRALNNLNMAYEEIASSKDELKHQFKEILDREERLKESEERYRSVVENAQDVLYRCDNEGRLIMVSPSALSLLGYDSLDELLGKKISDTFYQHPQDREILLQKLNETGSIYNFESTLVRKDKKTIFVSTNSHYYYNNDGTLGGIEGNIRDITDVKLANNAILESEELYRFLVEHIEDGVFIIQDDVLVFCNNNFADIMGYRPEEIVGKVIFDHISPENRDELIWKCHNAEDYSVILESYEVNLIHKENAKIVPVLLSLRIGNYKGKKACIGTTHSAEGVYEQVEHSLRKSKAMLNAILQESPIPQFVIDKNHRVMFWNLALERYSGIPSHEIIGTSDHWKAFYPNERPCLVDLVIDENFEEIGKWYENNAKKSNLVRDAYSSIDFFPHLRKNGIWLFFTGALLRDLNGNIWGGLETLEDITEQKMNEEGFRQANKKLNLLADITRHDILNTLTVLSGAFDIIKDEIAEKNFETDISPVEKALGTIYRQILFTRDYQNLGITAPYWQNLINLIQEEIENNLPSSIEFSFEDCEYEIYADGLLGRVFSNLLDNSIRHGEHVSKIQITVVKNDNQLIINYCDNGTGIHDDMKERIFERGVGTHTGYGLFLTREILSLTKISIHENGVFGKGVLFNIVIPEGFFRIIEKI
ncbi:MAG: PAS domain S-box protein [Methanomicrobiales archaeon]|nr:PAS domain S-box protein [Methanomicrobiales archaeon]